jgi:hypothetical protein
VSARVVVHHHHYPRPLLPVDPAVAPVDPVDPVDTARVRVIRAEDVETRPMGLPVAGLRRALPGSSEEEST